MTKSVFEDLKNMHDHYGIDRNKSPFVLTSTHMNFRLNFIKEEYNELVMAHKENNIEEIVDALIDISVVAIGTLDLMGVDGQRHWDEVYKCNMNKRLVTDPIKSKRGFAIDLEKPEGWVGPDHKSILQGRR